MFYLFVMSEITNLSIKEQSPQINKLTFWICLFCFLFEKIFWKEKLKENKNSDSSFFQFTANKRSILDQVEQGHLFCNFTSLNFKIDISNVKYEVCSPLDEEEKTRLFETEEKSYWLLTKKLDRSWVQWQTHIFKVLWISVSKKVVIEI